VPGAQSLVPVPVTHSGEYPAHPARSELAVSTESAFERIEYGPMILLANPVVRRIGAQF